MRHRLFTFLSVLSLVLFAICVIGWLWAAFAPAERFFVRSGRLWDIGIARGHAWMLWLDGWPADAPRHPKEALIYPETMGRETSSAGFYQTSGYAGAGLPGQTGLVVSHRPYRGIAVDFWLPALLALVLPTIYVTRIGLPARRARRRAQGHLCPACGYDLRATPERCPECGRIPEKAEA